MDKLLLGVPNQICWCCGQDRNACYRCGDYNHFVVKEDFAQCESLKEEVERLKGELNKILTEFDESVKNENRYYYGELLTQLRELIEVIK